MTHHEDAARTTDVVLLRRGRRLEWCTLGWNVVGVVVLVVAFVLLAGYVIVHDAAREALHVFRD